MTNLSFVTFEEDKEMNENELTRNAEIRETQTRKQTRQRRLGFMQGLSFCVHGVPPRGTWQEEDTDDQVLNETRRQES